MGMMKFVTDFWKRFNAKEIKHYTYKLRKINWETQEKNLDWRIKAKYAHKLPHHCIHIEKLRWFKSDKN